MSFTYRITQDRISDAINKLHNGNYSNLTAEARVFGVDPRTVQRKLHGGASKSSRLPTNRALNFKQEQAIKDYIQRLDEQDVSAKVTMIRAAANYILTKSHSDHLTPPPQVSENWTRRFLARNPEFYKRKQKPLAVERKNAHNEGDFMEYFEKYKDIRIEKRIADEDVWNIDETGFCAGCSRAHWVITLDPNKLLLLKDPDNREYITSVESISGGGKTILLLLILCGIYILEKWAEENDLDEDILLATSPTGYSNDELALQWLEHFEIHSRKSQVGVWRLLILDGYGSHLTYEFYEYAQKHCIELFRLPPHSTHLTQPLDVGCFQPFKHYHAEAIDDAIRSGSGDFGRLEFLAKFQFMRTQTFKKSTIKSAFKNTGLIPYNPEIILQKIRAFPKPIRKSTPLPPDRTNKMTLISATTPHCPHEVKIQAQTLINKMKNDHRLVHPKFPPYLDRFICGSVSNSLRCFITERDLKITYNEAIARAACKKLIGRVAQKGKVITVRDVQAKVTKRAENEVEKARRALDQAEAAELKKENAKIAVQKKIRKQLHKELKVYLKARPTLANLLK